MKAELRNYLSVQGEIGTDEVILPKPLIFQPAFQHAPGLQPTSPSNIFGNLARDFELANKVEEKAGSVKLKAVVDKKAVDDKSDTQAKIPEGVQLPAFSGLDEYWNYLEQNTRTLFASTQDVRILQGTGPLKARMALIAFAPSETDMAEGRLFAGEAGVLLGKMMRAIHLELSDLYCTSLIKHFAGKKVWSRRELTRILPLLHFEMSLNQIPVGLILGEANAQAILKTTKPMQELRQIPHREEGREYFVTYHPDDLLRREELKREAWQDLQWVERRMQQAQAHV